MKKLIAALFLVLMATSANSAGILVSWNANTETDLAGYVINYAAPGDTGWTLANGQWVFSGTLTHLAEVGKVTSWTLSNAVPGPYLLTIRAKDTAANLSDYAAPQGALIPAAAVPLVFPPIDVPPNKVLTVTVTIQ